MKEGIMDRLYQLICDINLSELKEQIFSDNISKWILNWQSAAIHEYDKINKKLNTVDNYEDYYKGAYDFFEWWYEKDITAGVYNSNEIKMIIEAFINGEDYV